MEGPEKNEDTDSFALLDNASSDVDQIWDDLSEARRMASDPLQPLEMRLEVYEDILESEVGDTTLSRARNIERETGVRQLYLKFEGNNPTGTQKDRIAFAQVLDALRRGYEVISFATCGNYGVAMAFAASQAGIKTLAYIPKGYRTRRLNEMEELGCSIIRTEGDYETAVALSSSAAVEKDYYDANPGGRNTDLQIRAYGEIAYEIYDELRDAPAVVAVPVSNGSTLAGIYKGFVSLFRRGKTSRIPRIVAGSSHSKNPIVAAWLKGLTTCVDLDPVKITESHINEPLINWHSIDGDHALLAIRKSGGWASDASDKDMLAQSRLLLEKEGLNVLPASTAGLLALLKQHRKTPFTNDRYVAILTGRK